MLANEDDDDGELGAEWATGGLLREAFNMGVEDDGEEETGWWMIRTPLRWSGAARAWRSGLSTCPDCSCSRRYPVDLKEGEGAGEIDPRELSETDGGAAPAVASDMDTTCGGICCVELVGNAGCGCPPPPSSPSLRTDASSAGGITSLTKWVGMVAAAPENSKGRPNVALVDKVGQWVRRGGGGVSPFVVAVVRRLRDHQGLVRQ